MAGRLFSRLVLNVSARPEIRSLATEPRLARGLVDRFVAGETLEQAIEATRQLNDRGLGVALDHLGENTATEAEASNTTSMAVHIVRQIHEQRLRAYLSVKLTQLGMDVGEHVVLANTTRLLEQAEAAGCFVRVDMEGSAYTARTIEIFGQLRRSHERVGIVIQAYLYRSLEDARRLTAIGAGIRLCKGAYDEPPHIAFRRKRDTDRNFVRIVEFLLEHGNAPAIATHDPAIIEHTRRFADSHRIRPDRFEFQMLYGVRRDLQEWLVREGYQVRVYVPFGSQWYPYLTRRLAERPANLLSVAGSVLRERRVAAGPVPGTGDYTASRAGR